jgi:hypothetical protein
VSIASFDLFLFPLLGIFRKRSISHYGKVTMTTKVSSTPSAEVASHTINLDVASLLAASKNGIVQISVPLVLNLNFTGVVAAQTIGEESTSKSTSPTSVTERKQRVVSEESRLKISLAQKARWDRRRAASPDGTKTSDESRQKISASMKARWAERKKTTPVLTSVAVAAEGSAETTEADRQTTT